MCRVEPVEQLLVAAAALAVVQRHADNGKNAEPLIVDCEHLGKGKIRQTAKLQKDQHKITQEGHSRPNDQPQALVVIQRIQRDAAGQKRPAAVGDARPHGKRCRDKPRQHGGADRRVLNFGKKHQQRCDAKRPDNRHGSSQCAPHKPALAQPVNALPDDAEQHQILKNGIQRVEAVPAAEGPCIDHKKFHSAHRSADGPDTQKVALAVMGVGEALNSAEQEQRCGQPRQHTEPFRHNTRKFKKVVDVVHHHEHQRNGFERRAGQAEFLLCHNNNPFTLLL